MSRQSIGLIIVIGVLGGLLLVRGFIGQGMGRIYTETVTKEFVEVNVPAADPMMVDPEQATAGGLVTERRWVPVDSEQAAKYRQEGSKVVTWEEKKQVPARNVLADPQNATATLDWPRTIGLWSAALFTLAIFSFLYKDLAGDGAETRRGVSADGKHAAVAYDREGL